MQQREIKFRMPEIINGKFAGWFYWGFCGEAEGEFIGPHSKYRQSPCFQYTGMRDRDGNEIYEGDILKWVSSNPFSLGDVRTVLVEYVPGRFWCRGDIYLELCELLANEKCQVIGNIINNPNAVPCLRK